jgi:hypothetical protein
MPTDSTVTVVVDASVLDNPVLQMYLQQVGYWSGGIGFTDNLEELKKLGFFALKAAIERETTLGPQMKVTGPNGKQIILTLRWNSIQFIARNVKDEPIVTVGFLR